MPFKSKAQRRKFAQLLVDGEITPEVFEEWNRETGGAKLPERVKKSSRRKSAAKRKSTRRPAARKRKGARPSPTAKKRGAAHR
jgi:hypothetical protein